MYGHFPAPKDTPPKQLYERNRQQAGYDTIMSHTEITNAPFLRGMCELTANMYRLGWDERNGGNVSCLLSDEELAPFRDTLIPKRRLPFSFDASELRGKVILVTGTGKYFKNVISDPEKNLGIVRIADSGREAELLWGFSDGGTFTSEFPAHLMSHIVRLHKDSKHRVIIHTHPTNTVALTHIHTLSDQAFTRTLWGTCTECIVVFPEGIGVLPWMICGNNEIGQQTARKMEQYRLVVWAQHGIYGAGTDYDEAFGLIETVEKGAELYMKYAAFPVLNKITDRQLDELARAFHLTYRKDFLDL